MHKILITYDTKGKVRVIDIRCDWNDEKHCYLLERQSGLLSGKKVQAPTVEIHRGKASRTVTEQATLQFNSEVKKYLDKGYIDSTLLDIADLTEDKAKELLPQDRTDQNGAKKPMLCKVFDFNDKKNDNKNWLASAKHDGKLMPSQNSVNSVNPEMGIPSQAN